MNRLMNWLTDTCTLLGLIIGIAITTNVKSCKQDHINKKQNYRIEQLEAESRRTIK